MQSLPPASVNVRKFVVRATHLEDVVQLGTLTTQCARFLGAAVSSGLNVLVSGGTPAGKTTLLNCLGAAIPSRGRVTGHLRGGLRALKSAVVTHQESWRRVMGARRKRGHVSGAPDVHVGVTVAAESLHVPGVVGVLVAGVRPHHAVLVDLRPALGVVVGRVAAPGDDVTSGTRSVAHGLVAGRNLYPLLRRYVSR